MLIRSRPRHDIRSSEITDPDLYLDRRRFIASAAGLAAAAALPPALFLPEAGRAAVRLGPIARSRYTTDEALTSYQDITHYNNFYEFSTDKEEVADLARSLRTDPWSVAIEGEVERPGVYHLEDILRPHALEERVYRLRCVEAWSMVIPWVGFPLADLIRRFAPTSRARYVEFTTLHDPEQMPGQRRHVLDWPYVEGLRMDEAMHPLTLIAVGLYGKVLPNQNGAPLRLVVPWKYGFKNVKSIVRIRFLERQPLTTWMKAGPREYGFYANVNPHVDHPRWSQARERRIGDFFKRDTLMFNGYGEEVAKLYAGMDLKRYF